MRYSTVMSHHQLRFADQQINEPEQDEFEKTMVIPTGQQNADQLAKAEKAADKAVAAIDDAAEGVKLDPEDVAALEDAPKAPSLGETVADDTPAHGATSAGIDPKSIPSALLRRSRTGTHQGTDHIGPAWCSGRCDNAPCGRLLHRPRGVGQGRRLPTGQRPTDRPTGQEAD